MYENMIHLYQKITQLKVLKLFMDNPYTSFYLRESSRILKMDPMTVKRSINLLLVNNLLTKTLEKNRILYKANIENPAFKHLKIYFNISYLNEKKIVQFLQDNMKTITSIILFGSYAKGENDKDSDIDILTISLSKDKPTAKLATLLKNDVNLVNFSSSQWKNQAKINRAFYLIASG